MKKPMSSKTMMTDAYEQFACIGGICPDNCCIGWQVELDRKTFQSYQLIQETELKKKIRRYVYLNPEEMDPSMDYGLVELLPNRRCPFLNSENLCSVQMEKGEAYLSNVCAGYPRMINRVEGVLEYSLTLSCPEGARLVLDREEPLKWIVGSGELGKRQILNVDYRASDYSGQFLAENLVMLRDKTVAILQDRQFSLARRIRLLGDFFEGLDAGRKPLSKPGRMEISGEEYSQSKKLLFWDKINSRFNTPEYLDSQRYLDKMKPSGQPMENGTFPKKLEIILENYLVNYVFQSLFPSGESRDPQDAFLKLGIRYALVKYGAMKISGGKDEVSRKQLIELIQCFSKATEHHFTYFDDILDHIKRQTGNTRQIRTLIEL